MNVLKKNINILFKGIYAGMMIGIGGSYGKGQKETRSAG